PSYVPIERWKFAASSIPSKAPAPSSPKATLSIQKMNGSANSRNSSQSLSPAQVQRVSRSMSFSKLCDSCHPKLKARGGNVFHRHQFNDVGLLVFCVSLLLGFI